MAFMDILPDPNTRILDSGIAGVNTAGSLTGNTGPGFASVKLSSNRKTMVDKTNSGRSVARSIAGHTWKVGITYNPLTRDQFEPVYSFLLSRLGRLNPFYVVLPNQSTIRNGGTPCTLNVQVHAGAGNTTANAGQTYMLLDKGNTGNLPRPGDMFTITDSANANHVKVYRTTRVETFANPNVGNYEATLPDGNTDYPADATEVRIHFTPPLAYSVSDTSALDFTSPKIRVRLAKDVQEYNLGTNNLYEFGLQLEEALP
jgi:hypothetical protein